MEIEVPPSKSHLMRAILFAALADGESTLSRLLESPDVVRMIEACRALGADIERRGDGLWVRGVAGRPQICQDVIDAGNSGIVLRFVAAAAALGDRRVHFTGDASVRFRRPVAPLISGLRQLGAQAGEADPLWVQGPLVGGKAMIDGADSQPVSALLIAGAFTPQPVELEVVNGGEKPWVELTRAWLRKLSLGSGKVHQGFSYVTPGDYSAAAFPLVAGLLTGVDVEVGPLDPGDVQGDRQLLVQLQGLGGKLFPTLYGWRAEGSELMGATIDVDPFIDAVPILAVVGCAAKGETRLVNGEIARYKECDRIAAITAELRKMGADIVERPDGLTVRSAQLRGANVEAHCDHRIAMALAVAARIARGLTTLRGGEWVVKSYPRFWNEWVYFDRASRCGEIDVRTTTGKPFGAPLCRHGSSD